MAIANCRVDEGPRQLRGNLYDLRLVSARLGCPLVIQERSVQQALLLLLVFLVRERITEPLFELFKRIQGVPEFLDCLVRALDLHFTPNFGIVAKEYAKRRVQYGLLLVTPVHGKPYLFTNGFFTSSSWFFLKFFLCDFTRIHCN